MVCRARLSWRSPPPGEAVADGLAGGGGDRCGAGAANAASVRRRPRCDRAVGLRGGDRADAGLGQQRWRERLDEWLHARFELGCFGAERERPAGGQAQRDELPQARSIRYTCTS